MSRTIGFRTAALCVLAPISVAAQSATNLTALRGLAPVSALAGSAEGRAALAANLRITGEIQSGVVRPPSLLDFDAQRQLALRDAFITDGNATELADGLGSRLGGLYQAKARYTDPETFTSVAPSVADLIGYTNNVAKSDSNAGKYFFANATTNGRTPVSDAARAILTEGGGTTDVFGQAYGRPAGTPGADAHGNARPFQTRRSCSPIAGTIISAGRRTASIGCGGRARICSTAPRTPAVTPPTATPNP